MGLHGFAGGSRDLRPVQVVPTVRVAPLQFPEDSANYWAPVQLNGIEIDGFDARCHIEVRRPAAADLYRCAAWRGALVVIDVETGLVLPEPFRAHDYWERISGPSSA